MRGKREKGEKGKKSKKIVFPFPLLTFAPFSPRSNKGAG
jgi:hypothetical protein